jgi:hypothetical protein
MVCPKGVIVVATDKDRSRCEGNRLFFALPVELILYINSLPRLNKWSLSNQSDTTTTRRCQNQRNEATKAWNILWLRDGRISDVTVPSFWAE